MTKVRIHPTASVSESARLGEGVEIGPYAVIADKVEIAGDTVVGPHVVVHDRVSMGSGNRIHAHAVLGDAPQHLSYAGEETRLEIGDRNIIREGVTIHRSMSPEKPTVIGSDCFLMAYSHVAHDCVVEDGVIITNNSCLGGHVEIGRKAVLGGGVMVHQYCRVGPYAMVGGMSGVRKDVLPYAMASGFPALHYRLNRIGLRRVGIRGERYAALEEAFRSLGAGSGLSDSPGTDEVEFLRKWLARRSKRGCAGFVRDRGRGALDPDIS
jgi:UDP-N-acetylglucosamine acyltransferase